MIVLDNDSLVFQFPDVHDDARCAIDFQRTLRIPMTARTTRCRRAWAACRCGISTTTRSACRGNGTAEAG